jgi:hypothetical protein
MAAPTFVFSEQNGSGAGTATDGIAAVVFASTDANSNTSGLTANYPIPTGTNSFEKYLRVKVTGAATNTLSAFSIYFSATAPTDGAGSASTLSVKYGMTNTYAAPVATASTVATTLCSTDTTSPGTAFTTDPANTVGAYSSYFVQQLLVASNATGGGITWPSPWATLPYSYS